MQPERRGHHRRRTQRRTRNDSSSIASTSISASCSNNTAFDTTSAPQPIDMFDSGKSHSGRPPEACPHRTHVRSGTQPSQNFLSSGREVASHRCVAEQVARQAHSNCAPTWRLLGNGLTRSAGPARVDLLLVDVPGEEWNRTCGECARAAPRTDHSTSAARRRRVAGVPDVPRSEAGRPSRWLAPRRPPSTSEPACSVTCSSRKPASSSWRRWLVSQLVSQRCPATRACRRSRSWPAPAVQGMGLTCALRPRGGRRHGYAWS